MTVPMMVVMMAVMMVGMRVCMTVGTTVGTTVDMTVGHHRHHWLQNRQFYTTDLRNSFQGLVSAILDQKTNKQKK